MFPLRDAKDVSGCQRLQGKMRRRRCEMLHDTEKDKKKKKIAFNEAMARKKQSRTRILGSEPILE